MAKSSMETNVRDAKEAILDEERFVTYLSLSKDLCIHVNEAKQILHQVVHDIQEKESNNNLNVSYIISGIKGDNSARTMVCSAAELDSCKQSFKTVFFHHIYGVSSCSSAVDSATTVSMNKLDDFSLCTGLIKGNFCRKRTSDEIGALKLNSQSQVSEQKVLAISKKEKNTNSMPSSDIKKITNINETKSAPIIKTEPITPKKESGPIPNGKTNPKNGQKPKGIAGFFSKSNSAPNVKTTTKKVEENKKINHKEADEKVEKINGTQTNKSGLKKEAESEEMEVDVDSPEPVKKEIKPAALKNNTSLSQIKKNAKVDKKRKRVLNVLDSDSDEDPFAGEKPTVKEESDDEIPPTPAANTVKITSGILNPRKKRKIVDKTYTDEEGYILTRKEEVYESCSEDEGDIKPAVVKKPEKENVEQTNKVKIEKAEISPPIKKTNSKKKISPPQKGKQATMMNFFKKI